MTNVTNELIYEVLKQIQGDVSSVRETLADHGRQLIRLREDIHNLNGELLRHERGLAGVELRLDRIEKRLSLVEA